MYHKLLFPGPDLTLHGPHKGGLLNYKSKCITPLLKPSSGFPSSPGTSPYVPTCLTTSSQSGPPPLAVTSLPFPTPATTCICLAPAGTPMLAVLSHTWVFRYKVQVIQSTGNKICSSSRALAMLHVLNSQVCEQLPSQTAQTYNSPVSTASSIRHWKPTQHHPSLPRAMIFLHTPCLPRLGTLVSESTP